jgi:hypothetical protein
MSDHDFDDLLRAIRGGRLRRRRFLKAAGVGVGASVVGTGTASAASTYDDVVETTYGELAKIDPDDLTEPDIPADPDIVDPGEGEGESIELPLGTPDDDGGGGQRAQNPQAATTGSSLSVETTYDGFTTRDVVRAIDIDDDGDDEVFFAIPSDNQLATGPNHHVTVINSEIGFIEKGAPEDGADRKGGPFDDDDYITHYRLEEFFEPVLSLADEEKDEGPLQFKNTQVFDPRVRYDSGAGRFYILCVEFNLRDVAQPDDFTGAFLLAVSSSDDPTEPWTVYRIPPTENFGLVDYPTLGYDGEAVYLAQNFFALPSFSFDGATLTVLKKDSLLDGTPVDAWEFSGLRNPDGSLAFTVQPAAMSGETGSYYLANSRFQEGRTVTVWDVTVPEDFSQPPGINNGAVRVAPYANAPGAEQPDTEKKVDTLDTRLMNLAYDSTDGTLWAAHTTASGDVRWYEIDPTGPTLVQGGAYGRPNQSTFLPTVESNGDSAVIVHNVSAETEYTGVEVAGRTDSFDTGQLEDSDVIKEGEVGYNYDDTRGAVGPGGEETVLRWGDYNGAAVDPKDGSYWVIGQYAKDPTPDAEGPDESELYGTRIANVKFED